MFRVLLPVLCVLLFCGATAEPLVFDCKIEGSKDAGGSGDLLVCRVRQNGVPVGTILLHGPIGPDPLWDAIVTPAMVRAMAGDAVFLRLACAVSPRFAPAESHGIINTGLLKRSEWDSLHVTDLRVISQTQFLGVTAKQPGS